MICSWGFRPKLDGLESPAVFRWFSAALDNRHPTSPAAARFLDFKSHCSIQKFSS